MNRGRVSDPALPPFGGSHLTGRVSDLTGRFERPSF